MNYVCMITLLRVGFWWALEWVRSMGKNPFARDLSNTWFEPGMEWGMWLALWAQGEGDPSGSVFRGRGRPTSIFCFNFGLGRVKRTWVFSWRPRGMTPKCHGGTSGAVSVDPSYTSSVVVGLPRRPARPFLFASGSLGWEFSVFRFLICYLSCRTNFSL